MIDLDQSAIFEIPDFIRNITENPVVNMTLAGDVNPCFSYPMTFLREQFYLVTVFGSSVALLSIIQNALLLYLFLRRKFFRRSYFFYFSILASFDLLHSFAYILVFGVCVFFEYTENITIMRIWFSYAVYAVAIAGVLRTTSVLILVAASIERWLYANDLAGFVSNRRRSKAIFVLFMVSLVVKGMVVLEMEVHHRPNCTGLSEYILVVSDLVQDSYFYSTVWTFWIRNILTIFIPFLLLIFLNLLVVCINRCSCIDVERTAELRLRYRRCGIVESDKDTREDILNVNNGIIHNKTDQWVSKARSRVRKAATRTFVIIVLESLIASGFSVFLATWEYIDHDSLRRFDAFYTFSNDIVSILSVLPCAIRLPTYWICDVTFRKELRWALCRGFLSVPRRKKRDHIPEEASTSRLLVPLRKSFDGASVSRTHASMAATTFGDVVLLAMESRRSATPGSPQINKLDSVENSSSPASVSTVPMIAGKPAPSKASPKSATKPISVAPIKRKNSGMRALVKLALQNEREMARKQSEKNDNPPTGEEASVNSGPEKERPGTSKISFADIL